MDNPSVLIPINDYLSIKSQARLRAVSKTCKNCIHVKQYSFYKIFKKLDIRPDTVLIMLFKLDENFLFLSDEAEFYYYPIKYHTHCNIIVKYALKYYSDCIRGLPYYIKTLDQYIFSILETASQHCAFYSDEILIHGLLVELCLLNY